MNATHRNNRVAFDLHQHGFITTEANNEVLTDEQLRLVVLLNKLQDIHQTQSCIHFDNCAFKEGVNYIHSEWDVINASGDHFDPVALGAFGRLLHTVQDFYAHSNWIELHLDATPIPVWNLSVEDLPAGMVSGTWVLGSPKDCSKGTPSHKELNKDNPSSEEGKKVVEGGPHKGRTLFELALDTAVQATIEQFERLRQSMGKQLAYRPEVKHEGTQRLIEAARETERLRDRM